MRKQYHFRPSDNGLYAWDVDRLVELSREISPKEIPLNNITEFEESYWFNDQENSPTCRTITEHFKLIQESDLSYPIILSSNGRVMDGMHRVCKAHLEKRDTIRAVQFTKDPLPDYTDVHPDDLSYGR